MRNPRGASPELLARTRRVVLKCGRSHDARPPARAGAQRNSARARSAPRVQLFHHPIACAVAPIGAGAGGVCVDAASAIAPHLPAQPRGSASTGSGSPSCGSSSPLRWRTTGARCASHGTCAPPKTGAPVVGHRRIVVLCCCQIEVRLTFCFPSNSQIFAAFVTTVHIMMRTPHPGRSAKLSIIELSQY